MKKVVIVFSIIACMIFQVACATEQVDYSSQYDVSENELVNYGKQVVDTLVEVINADEMAIYENESIIYAGLSSIKAMLESTGTYQGITSVTVEYEKEAIVIHVNIAGSIRDGVIEISLDNTFAISNINGDANFSFGDLMKNAGLNTAIGMSVVFSILILICILISCFRFIPMLEEKFKKNKQDVFDQIVEKEEIQVKQDEQVTEQEVDDLELIAVITAAISAYIESETENGAIEDNTISADNYRVTSIRRRKN